jgi:hypothetical protein
MIAAIQSAFRFSLRSLAMLRQRVVHEDNRLTDAQRDGVGAWHFF